MQLIGNAMQRDVHGKSLFLYNINKTK